MTQRHTQDKGWGYRLACLAVGLVVGVGATLGISAACGLFDSSDSGASEATATTGGLVVGDTDNKGVSLTATQLTVPEGAEYESAYSITAEVTPSTATDTTIELSLAFSGTEVSWGTASSGVVTDYIRLSDGWIESGGSVTLYCYQAFGEQIILTGEAEGSASGATVSGTVTLDYAAKYTAVAFSDDGYLNAGMKEVFADVDGVDVNDFADPAYGVTYAGISNTDEIAIYAKYSSTYTVVDGIESGSINASVVSNLSTSMTTTTSSLPLLALGDAAYSLSDSSSSNITYCLLSDKLNMNPTDLVEFYLGGKAESGSTTFGYSFTSEELKEIYETLYDAYSSGEAAFTITVTFTGAQTGIEYTLTCDMMYNPDGMYAYATAVEFSDSGLIF